MNSIIKPQLTNEKSLKTLVENRTLYALDKCELNVFETHQAASQVPLTFGDLVVTSMVRGKKIMQLDDDPSFTYLPGETVIVPPNVTMKIDFPEASFYTPTQCIALAIDHEHIARTLEFLNYKYPREGKNSWELKMNDYFFYNTAELTEVINKLMFVCMDNNQMKDVIADLTLQELLVRLIQLQHRNMLEVDAKENHGKNAITFTVNYIKENVLNKITIEELCKLACMSKATFYRVFKRELGMSPNEFLILERIKIAKKFIRETSVSINQIAYEVGFEDVNYFCRTFRKLEQISPTQYRLLHNGIA
jgi:AraC-like DNA-binding protein